uniref:Uncharacterized protein n=1 Tax=Arundo donax TaxID=35708 RepID=A0A0A9DHQ4_ARUDO
MQRPRRTSTSAGWIRRRRALRLPRHRALRLPRRQRDVRSWWRRRRIRRLARRRRSLRPRWREAAVTSDELVHGGVAATRCYASLCRAAGATHGGATAKAASSDKLAVQGCLSPLFFSPPPTGSLRKGGWRSPSLPSYGGRRRTSGGPPIGRCAAAREGSREERRGRGGPRCSMRLGISRFPWLRPWAGTGAADPRAVAPASTAARRGVGWGHRRRRGGRRHPPSQIRARTSSRGLRRWRRLRVTREEVPCSTAAPSTEVSSDGASRRSGAGVAAPGASGRGAR